MMNPLCGTKRYSVTRQPVGLTMRNVVSSRRMENCIIVFWDEKAKEFREVVGKWGHCRPV